MYTLLHTDYSLAVAEVFYLLMVFGNSNCYFTKVINYIYSLWVDDEGSEAGFEGYSMEEGERGLEGGGQGTTKTGNDWKINGL